jgi:hypothetical protein
LARVLGKLQSEELRMSDENQNPDQEAVAEPTELVAQPAETVIVEHDSVDLALRFLVGLLAMGGDEAAVRLQEAQRRLDEEPLLWSSESTFGDWSVRQRAWYLGVGLMKRGRKGLNWGLNRSYKLSRRATSRIAAASDRWGLTYLTRPLRRPFEDRALRWRREARVIALEGELEDQKGRALAMGTLAAMIIEVMDEIAQNPQMLEFVEDLLGQQGKGMASSMMDNARSVTLTADDAADGLLRWLLRRKPRRDLPPSPVEGQPQTMYAPTAQVEGGAADDE